MSERPARASGRDTPPAVLLGGDLIAVSAARCLASAGVRVSAIGAAGDPLRRSRVCASYAPLPGSDAVQREYLDALDGAPEGAAVLPCNDDGLEVVARNRAALVSRGLRPVEADDEVVLAMLDKATTYERAAEVGIPTPRWQLVRTASEARAAAESFPFPCALKPLHTHLFARHFGIRRKVVVVEHPDQLEQALAEIEGLGLEMMLTEIVPGADDQYFSYYSYLDEAGEPLFHFTKRKLRQWPVGFGLATYHLSGWYPDAAELGLRFFRGVGLRGIGNVEFKRDSRDGRLKLIECNARMTAANELVRSVGIDIALLAYSRLAQVEPPVMDGYRTGAHMWNPVEDVRAFAELRRRGQLTGRRWARSLMHRQHFPLFRVDDPLPTVVNLAAGARGLARRAAVGRPRPERELAGAT